MKKLEFKNPHYVVTASANEPAEIRLIGEIGWWKNSSEEFTSIIDQLLEAGYTELNAYMNSGGGDMFEAPEIYNQVKRFTGNKKLTIGALCGSAATVIACAFDEVYQFKTGLYMVHNPQIGVCGDENDLLAGIQIYNACRELSIDIYMAKTGLPKETIMAMMDATTYMRADKAKELGFINEVIDNISEDEELSKVDMKDDTKEVVKKLRKVGMVQMKSQSTPPTPTPNPTPQPSNMNKPKMISALMKADINVAADATDEQLLEAVETLATKHKEVTAEMATLRTDVAKKKATMIADSLIAAKKATESEREEIVQMAIVNPELVEKAYAKVPTVTQASTQIHTQHSDPNVSMEGKSFSERFKAQPEVMLKMKAENPSEYAKLYKAEYGRDPQ